MCQQLNLMCYLSDTAPRSGSFTLWPDSHRLLYGAFEFEFNDGRAPGGEGNAYVRRYKELHAEAIERIVPVEVCGDAGDVIYWHGRTLHSAGIRRGGAIRLAVPADFQQQRPTLTEGDHKCPRGWVDGTGRGVSSGKGDSSDRGHEWFKDSVVLADDRPPQLDMWSSRRI